MLCVSQPNLLAHASYRTQPVQLARTIAGLMSCEAI